MAAPNSVAYRRFLANAPIDQREYRTIELYHPEFTYTPRFVQDRVNFDFTLEAGAPRNASQLITFTAMAMQVTEPQEEQGLEQTLMIRLGGVGAEVQDQIDLIRGQEVLTPIECVYRKYYSGDIGAPVKVIYLSVSGVRFDNYTGVAVTAEDVDLANKASSARYTLERFPMLRNL